MLFLGGSSFTEHLRRAMKKAAVSLILVLASLNLTGLASAPSPPANFHITAPGEPNITSQPQNQTVIAGQSATFAVGATGDAPLNYQWTFNGLNVGSGSSYTRV